MSTERAFVKWASKSLTAPDDLPALHEMIGDASIVALGEGAHGAAEPLEFRNRLFQYLVEHAGFTAIALESGIVESRLLHDYVRGDSGDLDTALANGLSWTFDRLPQNRSLVQWMRDYNTASTHGRTLSIYGFDVSGSLGNDHSHRGADTALVEALAFLEQADQALAEQIHSRIRPLLPHLRFELNGEPDALGYHQLGALQRDVLTAAIADLIATMEREEARFIAACGEREYTWGHRAAIAARQVDNGLRRIPLGWQPSEETFPTSQTRFVLDIEAGRDRSQADNLEWIVNQEGPSGKILVFAHRYHLSTTPVARSFDECGTRVEYRHEMAGTYLKRRFADRLVTIGNLIGEGELRCGDFHETIVAQPPGSIDGVAGALNATAFLLDLRTAPEGAREWLEKGREHTQGASTFRLSLARAFDILLYFHRVTRACEPMPSA